MGLPFLAALRWTVAILLGAFAIRLIWPVGVDESRIKPGNSIGSFHYVRVPIAAGKGHLNVISHGPKNGTVMIFLHGFPQSAALAWEHQIHHFAGKGYRVLAPDQRGYNNSYAPAGVTPYHIDRMTQDVSDLLSWAGAKKAIIVGHDWGGFVAWRFAETRPGSIIKLVILNSPYRLAFRDTLMEGITQWTYSWYMLFFQLPVLPEFKFSANYFAGLRTAMLTARPLTFNVAQMKAHISVWKKSLGTMINWYRATPRSDRVAPLANPIQPRTLVLWGENDYFLTLRTAELTLNYCRHARLEVIKGGTTHWISHEEPTKVNRAILKFIQNNDKQRK